MVENVVSISDYGECRKHRIEKWLRHEMTEQYGEYDGIKDNLLLRIYTKFDAADGRVQLKLLGYAERCMLERVGAPNSRDRFWNILEKVGRDSWQDIERYADKLLAKELEAGKLCAASGCREARG